MSSALPMAVFGAGVFGRHHVRVLSHMPDVDLVAIVDADIEKARTLAADYGIEAVATFDQLPRDIEAATVATPTITHENLAADLLGSGIDVLVEKPIAASSEAGERLTHLAEENGQILQVGHLERFNPAVSQLEQAVTVPLFFEVHRLSVFTPRSLDVDVVLDLMIHDLDIILHIMGEMPSEIRAAGISVLSRKVDIANVRLAFKSGCVANLTASRVSTEQIRKLRLFQPGEYLAIDYKRQDLTRFHVLSNQQIGFEAIPTQPGEPLQLELASFVNAVRQRSRPKVGGKAATQALRLGEAILATIEEHAEIVSGTILRGAPLK